MKHERKQCDGVVTYHSVGSVMAHAVVLNEGGVRGGEREPKTKHTNNNLEIFYDILFQ